MYGVRQYCQFKWTYCSSNLNCVREMYPWHGLLFIPSLVKTQVSASVPQFCFFPSDKEVPECEFLNQSMGSLSH